MWWIERPVFSLFSSAVKKNTLSGPLGSLPAGVLASIPNRRAAQWVYACHWRLYQNQKSPTLWCAVRDLFGISFSVLFLTLELKETGKTDKNETTLVALKAR